MHVLAMIAAEDNGGGAAGLFQVGILLLIPLAMYFLMIRPQRRRMREQQAMQASLEVGDEVMTASGIYGFITGFEEDRVWIEIDDDVQVRVNRAFLQGRVTTGDGPAPGSTSSTSSTGTPGTGSSRITPTVKGRKTDTTASEGADAGADAAERTDPE